MALIMALLKCHALSSMVNTAKGVCCVRVINMKYRRAGPRSQPAGGDRGIGIKENNQRIGGIMKAASARMAPINLQMAHG